MLLSFLDGITADDDSTMCRYAEHVGATFGCIVDAMWKEAKETAFCISIAGAAEADMAAAVSAASVDASTWSAPISERTPLHETGPIRNSEHRPIHQHCKIP